MTTFTKAAHVRLKRLPEDAATEILRRSGKQVPLIYKRDACTDHSSP